MTQKEWNANTKVSDSDIIMMYNQTKAFNTEITKLRNAKNQIPKNFGITKSRYLSRLKQLKESGELR